MSTISEHVEVINKIDELLSNARIEINRDYSGGFAAISLGLYPAGDKKWDEDDLLGPLSDLYKSLKRIQASKAKGAIQARVEKILDRFQTMLDLARKERIFPNELDDVTGNIRTCSEDDMILEATGDVKSFRSALNEFKKLSIHIPTASAKDSNPSPSERELVKEISRHKHFDRIAKPIGPDIEITLKELIECLLNDCRISTICLCGRLVEAGLKQILWQFENKDVWDRKDGIEKLRERINNNERIPSEHFPEFFNKNISLIQQYRNAQAHSRDYPEFPEKRHVMEAVAAMCGLWTDILNGRFDETKASTSDTKTNRSE